MHLCHHHQHFIHNCESKSEWYLETKIHVFHSHQWYHFFHFHEDFREHDEKKNISTTIYHGKLGYGRKRGWYETYITSTITIKNFSMIVKWRVDGFLRPKSMSSIINTYITPLFTIITTYISPLITIITTNITLLIETTTISYSLVTIKFFMNRTRRKQETLQSIMDTWVMGARVAGLRPICISTVNINSWSTIVRGRVDGLLRHIPTSKFFTTLITTMINYMIVRGISAVILITISTSTIVTTMIN